MDDVEDKGLIVIPEPIKKENTPLPTTGVVVKLGPEIPCYVCGQTEYAHRAYPQKIDGFEHTFDPTFKLNDMVMFPKFGGTNFRIENEDLLIVEAKEVMCTMAATEEGSVEWVDASKA